MAITNIQLNVSTATLTANTITEIKTANASRKYLFLQNTGTGSVTFGVVASFSVGLGFISLDPASTAGGQGGSAEYTTDIPTNPIYALSGAGTTVTVVDG